MSFFIASLTGCSRGDSPDGAVKDFLRASASGDNASLYAMLTPDVQKKLRDGAQMATAHIGGRRRLQGADLIAASLAKPKMSLGIVEVIKREGDHAEVKLSDSKGKYSEIWILKRIDGKWRIRLPGAVTATKKALKKAPAQKANL